MKVVVVTKSAIPLANSMATTSLPRMDVRGDFTLLAGFDQISDTKQFGANLQPGRFNFGQVDVEIDAAIAVSPESDHAPSPGEAVDVTHGKNAASAEFSDDSVDLRGFRSADK